MGPLTLAVIVCASAALAVGEPPPRDAAVRSVVFLPEMWGDSQRTARVLCQDGALATPVPGGTLWTFGDTFMGTRDAEGKPQFAGAHSNTMAFLPAGASGWPPPLRYLSSGVDSKAAPPLALLAGEDPKTRRLWPLAGVWLEGERDAGADSLAPGRAYMFYGLIDVTGPGPWGFKGVGTGLARSREPFAVYERLPQPPGEGNAGPGWPIDASSLVRDAGWLYLYAPRRFKGEKDLSSGLLVARVRERDIEDPARYEFFAGLDAQDAKDAQPRWTARVGDAAPAAPDVWGQASVAWNEWLGAYLLATSANIFRHDEIRLRSAPTPWGPWTALSPDGGVIKVPPREGEETQLIYCTMLHPELDAERGRVVTLTFCRMLKRDWALTNPEAVRVEFGPAEPTPR